MGTFPAKISWERPRKRENRKNRSDEFLPNPELGIPKKLQKNSKNSTMTSFQAKIGWERLRKRENKKKIVTMSSYPTWN